MGWESCRGKAERHKRRSDSAVAFSAGRYTDKRPVARSKRLLLDREDAGPVTSESGQGRGVPSLTPRQQPPSAQPRSCPVPRGLHLKTPSLQTPTSLVHLHVIYIFVCVYIYI